jgi:hypothetical protein
MKMESKILKKYLIGILVIALLNFIGCYSSEVVNKEDFQDGKLQIDFSEELYLTTKDSTNYHFLPANFQIVNDTLYGSGAIEASSSIAPFKGAIALDEIINFEQSKPDTGATIGLIAGIIAVGLLVGVIIIAVEYSNSTVF